MTEAAPDILCTARPVFILWSHHRYSPLSGPGHCCQDAHYTTVLSGCSLHYCQDTLQLRDRGTSGWVWAGLVGGEILVGSVESCVPLLPLQAGVICDMVRHQHQHQHQHRASGHQGTGTGAESATIDYLLTPLHLATFLKEQLYFVQIYLLQM